ncbi:MAG TPA: hypothetical protein VD886_15015, partial [Herpetosiphonaceae bacterium]|nr:hypothetical protein [Herpetosiphonaceae bacterium]
MTNADPHAGVRLLAAGAPLAGARAAMLMIHGRGANAESILGLAGEFAAPGWAFVAPQASGNTWYPHSFLQPIERNEPFLSSALAAVSRTFD